MRASDDGGRGRPRECGPREMVYAIGGEGGKGGREKEGKGFAAAGHGASRWMGHALRSGVGLLGRGSGV